MKSHQMTDSADYEDVLSDHSWSQKTIDYEKTSLLSADRSHTALCSPE